MNQEGSLAGEAMDAEASDAVIVRRQGGLRQPFFRLLGLRSSAEITSAFHSPSGRVEPQARRGAILALPGRYRIRPSRRAGG